MLVTLHNIASVCDVSCTATVAINVQAAITIFQAFAFASQHSWCYVKEFNFSIEISLSFLKLDPVLSLLPNIVKNGLVLHEQWATMCVCESSDMGSYTLGKG